jgi:uncharacterized protein YkwD
MFRRTAAICIIAATGLTLGIGPASAKESPDAPAGLVELLQGIDANTPDAAQSDRAQAVNRLAGKPVPEPVAAALQQASQRLMAQARLRVKRLAEEQADAVHTSRTLANLRQLALKAIVLQPHDDPDAWLRSVHQHTAAIRTYICGPLGVHFAPSQELGRLVNALEELHGYATMLGLETSQAPGPTASLRELFCREVLLGDIERQVVRHNQELAPDLSQAENRCIELINNYRMLLGLHPLKIDLRLVRACRKYAQECAQKNHYSHVGSLPGRETRDQRAAEEGYRAHVAENLAFGTKIVTGQDAFGEWFRSMPHHRVMINRRHALLASNDKTAWKYPRYYTIGVGHAPGGRYENNWCLLLGTGHPQDDIAVSQKSPRDKAPVER